MTWARLLAGNNVTQLATTKAELDNLRSIVTRSLGDVAAPDRALHASARGLGQGGRRNAAAPVPMASTVTWPITGQENKARC